MINTMVKPIVTSTFMVAPYTAAQLRTLDGLIVGMAKRAYGQRRSAPTAMATEDVAKFGMGCPSLLVEYMQDKVKYLTEAINQCAWTIWHSQPVSAAPASQITGWPG